MPMPSGASGIRNKEVELNRIKGRRMKKKIGSREGDPARQHQGKACEKWDRGKMIYICTRQPCSLKFDLTGTPADDDHPAHDVANGQRLVKDVYETLRASPQWNTTLLLVTYDEHGGFYDHVATPVAGVPSPDGLRGPVPFFFKFDRLGVRVPTLMISPWINKGTVVGRPPNGPTPTSEYEHSSIPATIKKIFNLRSGFLTKRDEWAGTFEHIFTQLDEPRTDCPETLPEVPFVRTRPAKEHGLLSDFQRELVELASFLNGDYMLTSFAEETKKKMTVKQANSYVRRAITSFLRASKQARRLGANESAIVTMRPSLTKCTYVDHSLNICNKDLRRSAVLDKLTITRGALFVLIYRSLRLIGGIYEFKLGT